MFNGEDQLVVGIDHDVRAARSEGTFLLAVEIRQHLFVRSIEPRLKVMAGIASAIATGTKAVVATGPDGVLPVVRHAAACVIASNGVALRVDEPAQTGLREGCQSCAHQVH